MTDLDQEFAVAHMLSQLPDIAEARFPPTYQAVVVALQQCVAIDECWDWADRAAALASYGKQAEDPRLFAMARRVQGRAVHRCGELLREIEPGQGARDGKRQDGAGPPLNRTTAATEAGLSERQRKTALRVAAIPSAEFEEMIESAEPPTVTELAARGTEHRDHEPPALGERSPHAFAAATTLLGVFTDFSREWRRLNVPLAIAGLDAVERERAHKLAAEILDWAVELVEALDVQRQ